MMRPNPATSTGPTARLLTTAMREAVVASLSESVATGPIVDAGSGTTYRKSPYFAYTNSPDPRTMAASLAPTAGRPDIGRGSTNSPRRKTAFIPSHGPRSRNASGNPVARIPTVNQSRLNSCVFGHAPERTFWRWVGCARWKPARNRRNVGTTSRYAYRRTSRPAVEPTLPRTIADEKSMTPLMNQKVRIDGANRQVFRMAVRWPLENSNSCDRSSAKADERFEPSSRRLPGCRASDFNRIAC